MDNIPKDQQPLFGDNLKKTVSLKNAKYHGPGFDESLDRVRLGGQMLRIYDCMKDGQWYTLQEISAATGAPEASASAQLRKFRAKDFGENVVERRRRGEPTRGHWEYKLILNQDVIFNK